MIGWGDTDGLVVRKRKKEKKKHGRGRVRFVLGYWVGEFSFKKYRSRKANKQTNNRCM